MTKTTIDLGKGGIDVMLAINELPRWPEWAKTAEARQKLVEEEAVVRDDLVHYNYSYGAMDLERTMAHFAEDIVIVNPGGTFVGSDLVRRNYEHLFADSPSARHLWGDVTVRFISPDEAYRTAIIYESHAKIQWWGVSTDIHQLRKIDGRWKIVKRCIVMDGSFKAIPEDADLEVGRRAILAEAQQGAR